MAATGDATAQDLNLPRTWIRPYYASFNGLRGLAVAMVFVCHYSYFLRPSVLQVASILNETLWVGVDLFFVLSGFLITGILYDSLQDPNYFRNFYVRRTLRIFPVMYGFFLLVILLKPLLHLHMESGMWAFVLYVGNLTMPFSKMAGRNPSLIYMGRHLHEVLVGDMSHLWSLCVEEQFYLVWPAVVLWVRDRRRLMQLCVVVSVGVLALRILLNAVVNPELIQNLLIFRATYTRCDTLLIGSWLALYLRGKALSIHQIRRSSTWLLCCSVALMAAGEALWGVHRNGIFSNWFTITWGYTLIALAAVAVLLRTLDDAGMLARMMRNRALSALGVISYGFYFYHGAYFGLWQDLMFRHPKLAPLIPVLAFASTVVIAWLSFRFMETPFLRLKRVLAPQHAGVGAQGFVPARLHVSEPEVN